MAQETKERGEGERGDERNAMQEWDRGGIEEGKGRDNAEDERGEKEARDDEL